MSRTLWPILLLAMPVHASATSLAPLGWLAGCWQSEGGEPGSGETWARPAGDSMLGIARTVRAGRTVAFEFLHIARADDGAYVLHARPSGQPDARFRLLELTAQGVVFSNPEHDFPQRILYTRLGEGRMRGRIEGVIDGQPRSADFPMRRIACEPAPAGKTSG